ncbi:MAG: recombinase family protein, partial [Lachnospiraceae bacterium]|nr:recombinase family protein [Lachnospiraceae bacterium]
GYGTHTSAEILFQKGYRNRNGKMLTPAIIRNIIRNPVYKGTVVQNKYHYEFESKQIVKNPESEWIVHEGAVPAIVDEALFMAANQALDERKREGQREGKDIGYRNNTGSHDLSGKIICGLCGSPFYRTIRQNKSGKVIEWKCSNYLQHGRRAEVLRRDQIRKAKKRENAGCDNVHLDEKKLLFCLEQVCGCQNDKTEQKELLREMLQLMRKAFAENGTEERRELLETDLKKAEYRKNLLLEKLLEGIIDDQDYQRKNQELQGTIDHCKEQAAQLKDDTMQNRKLEARLAMIRERLEQGIIQQAQTAEMISGIMKIAVYPERMEINLPLRMLITVSQDCSTSHYPMMEAEKRQILLLMQKKPEITAREIAGEMGVHLSLVHRRIRALKAEGRINYSTPNGRGKWVMINPPT